MWLKSLPILAVAFFVAFSDAMAVFTLPELPTTDIEAAGVAVAGLIAVYVVVRLAIRMIKGA